MEECSYKDGGVQVKKSIHMVPRSNIYFAPVFSKCSSLVITVGWLDVKEGIALGFILAQRWNQNLKAMLHLRGLDFKKSHA